MPESTILNPELFTIVRKYISATTFEELELYSRILYARKVHYRIAHQEGRLDIIMSYKLADEPDLLKALGIKSSDLYLYFDHS